LWGSKPLSPTLKFRHYREGGGERWRDVEGSGGEEKQ